MYYIIGDVALLSPRQMKPGMVNHTGIIQTADGTVDAPIGLGELAGLTVTNEAGPLLDVSYYFYVQIECFFLKKFI